MKQTLENNVLTLFLEGRIDTNNATQVGDELLAALAAAPGAELRLDAGELEYISSAGLRSLMKLRKQYKKPLGVWNVSPEVYEIFEVTGFTELLDVHKRLREVSVEGLPLLGEGANGKVYRLTPDQIIKVFRPTIAFDEIEQEREAAKRAFLLGVPCAIAFDTVRCGDSLGTIYELLDAATVTERIRENPDTVERYAETTAQLLRTLHGIELEEGEMAEGDHVLYDRFDLLKEDFTPEEIALMRSFYDAIPKGNRFIHNDFHTKNVMESKGELLLIDLGDAGRGNPLIDLIHCKLVYCLMGSGQREPDQLSFIGLTYGELERYWKVFLSTYCGSDEKAKKLDELMAPYAELMYRITSMAHPLLPKEYHAVYAKHLRENLFPRIPELTGSLSDLGDLLPA